MGYIRNSLIYTNANLKKKERSQVSTLTLNLEELLQAPVVHACNPSYSGGRDQEDAG
jgi:hypothetical protein